MRRILFLFIPLLFVPFLFVSSRAVPLPLPLPSSLPIITVSPDLEPDLTPDPVPDPTPDPVSDPTLDPVPDPTLDPVPDPTLAPSPDPTVVPGTDYVPWQGSGSSSGMGYLPPDQFFALEDDYSVSFIAVQSTPNTPVESSSGLKGILIKLFGPYSPTITQFRYQSNTSTNYTYVNDISPDFPWLCSAAIFAIVLFCIFKLGGTFLCKT